MNRWNHESSPIRRAGRTGVAALLSVASVGCSDGPTTPGDDGVPSLTVPAASEWTYVSLGTSSSIVSVANPSAATDWDLAFFATGVMLNGGAAGPAGVKGYCLCQNESLTDAQVKALNPAAELAAFRAVTAAQIPTDTTHWRSDALSPAIAGWYAYDPATHTVAPAADRSWVLRTASGPSFAKLRVARIEGAERASAGRVTLEYALQGARGGTMGELQSLTVDLTGGAKRYVSLTRGAVTDASDWDLLLEGFDIRVNGGISGGGRVGAVLANEPFAAVRDADGVPDAVFRADAFGGVFDARKWYRYNVGGTDHQIWPTYDVYLVRRGTTVYKLQITGYYNQAGQDRHVTFRYAKLTD